MKNYVISLTTATERREHIINEFGKQGIEFEFFDAVTYNHIDDICSKLGLENLKQSHNLANSEKGCFLSHLTLWKKMIDEDMAWIAIFEDDIHLGEYATYFLQDMNWLNEKVLLLKIEHFYPSLLLGKSIQSVYSREIHPLYDSNLGTAGYIIHKSIAQKLLLLLQSMTAQEIVPIDHFMFKEVIEKNLINVYQINPALCIQSDRLNPETNLKSDIHHERRLRMNNEKKNRTLIQKIKRELNRLSYQAFQQSHKKQNMEFK